MLESIDEQVANASDTEAEDFGQAIKKLSCRIQLTKKLQEQLHQSGALPTIENDKRQFVRFNCKARGILYCRQTLPAIHRPEAQYIVFVTNLSRGGLCFWHQDQLYPRERIMIWVESGRKFDIEVTRCRMINKQCYEIGARFV